MLTLEEILKERKPNILVVVNEIKCNSVNKIVAYTLLAYKRRHRTIIKDLYQFFLHLPKFNREIDYLQKLKNNHNGDKI